MARRRSDPLAVKARAPRQIQSLVSPVVPARHRALRAGSGTYMDPVAMLDVEALSLAFCPASGDFGSQYIRAEARRPRACGMPASNSNGPPRHLKERINSAIEQDIIPRLMMTYLRYDEQRVEDTVRRALGPPTRREQLDYERLAMQAVLEDVETLRQQLDALVDEGVPLTEIFLGLMAPAARHLGHLWTLDAIDFSSVTIGLARLQQLVHSYGTVFTTPARDVPGPVRRILLTPAPGEQHTFGLILVGEFMRRSGWEVTSMMSCQREQIVAAVKSEPYDVVGVSIGNESDFPDVRTLLKQVRRWSRTPDVRALVGGTAIDGDLFKVLELGADGTAADGRQVAAVASRLIDMRANNC